MSDDPKIRQFADLTGADDAAATQALAAADGDLDQALAQHFDTGDEASPPEPAVKPSLPADKPEELVGSILSQARQGDEDEKSKSWGEGRALGSNTAAESDGGGSASAASSAPHDAAAGSAPPALVDRRNAKRVRVIFWADGFTVEDVTAEEAAAEAEAKAPSAPRRTGLATLSSEKARSPAAPIPKLPELRTYEDNKEFMEDLKRSIPPKEFREVDLSSGVPQPRPVDIMLGDMRPQAYPKELVQRANAMAAMAAGKDEASRAKQKPIVSAFSGEGRTLGGSSSSSATATSDVASSSASGTAAGAAPSKWPSSSRDPPSIDEAAAIEVQVRLPGAPQRFRLNKTHTIADLKHLVEAALATGGEAPRDYVLMCGFPPKPLTDETATVEEAGLVGAAVTHRWA